MLRFDKRSKMIRICIDPWHGRLAKEIWIRVELIRVEMASLRKILKERWTIIPGFHNCMGCLTHLDFLHFGMI